MKGFVTVIVVGLALVGCQPGGSAPPVYDVRMGESAPEFGSTDATKTIAQFVVGHWALTDYLDPEFAKQLGLGALSKEMEGQPVTHMFELKSDGTFTYQKKKADWVVAGKWQDTGQGIALTYETYNGKPLRQVQDEMRKAAEGGTQAAIAQDIFMDWLFGDLQKLTTATVASNKRLLVFTSPDGGQLQLNAGTALERLTTASK